MKEYIKTTGIVLRRTDFREADRILTLITPFNGKISVIAKGARRSKSKLAGGIELLSISDFSILPGRGDLSTLISSRLITHYGNIVKDINRTILAYGFLKRINRITEEAAGEEYFMILQRSLIALNELSQPAELVELWFTMQLLNVSGHNPNLQTDDNGKKLEVDQKYIFDVEQMCFCLKDNGSFDSQHIKLLRLSQGQENPVSLSNTADIQPLLGVALGLAKELLSQQVRV